MSNFNTNDLASQLVCGRYYQSDEPCFKLTKIIEMLCDACLARLERSLNGETTPHEFLECLLIVGDESNFERFFCRRCTEKLHQLRFSLLSPVAPKSK